MTFNYDFHGIVKVTSNINLRFNYFKVDTVKHDLAIRLVSDIKIDLNNAKKLGLLYFGTENENWVYYESSIYGIKLKVLLKDLLGKTELWMTKPYYLSRLPAGFWALINAILQIKFLQKRCFLLHSACLSTNEEGILISAYADTGKTLTVLRCLQRGTFSYLSDDVTIIDDKGVAWCLPRLINFRTLARAGYLRGQSITKTLRNRLATRISEVPFLSSYIEPLDAIDIYKALDISIKKLVKIKNLFLLERDKEEWDRLDKSQAFKKLQMINKIEFKGFPDIIHTYAYLNQNFDIEDLISEEKRLMGNLLDNSKCYVLRSELPYRFADTLNQILRQS